MSRIKATVLLFCGFAFSYPAIGRTVLPFASHFSCSDPTLQWQFEHIPSLYFENAKAIKETSETPLKIIDSEGALDGNNSPWLYRGVTNSQFNESQILRVVFNDSTSVSESRWLTTKMYGEAGGDLPTLRQTFQNLPIQTQIKKFKAAYEKVDDTIKNLVNTPNGNFDGMLPHLQIEGSVFNGTPVAGQFLTPHKQYAEFYGEFVLFVREVFKRGVDLERYNYHLLNYSVGSIYEHDQDEYFVPSNIPSWDVQVVKVRHGASGWHQMNYGPPAYYYTKLYRDKNPCDVYAVRVDKPADDGNDDRRTPVGVLLKCADDANCNSRWDGALGSEEATLKEVVDSVRVDGHKIRYLPYKLFRINNRDVITQMDLATLDQSFSDVPAKFKSDTSLWSGIILKSYPDDMSSALDLIKKLPFSTGDLVASLKADFENKIQSGQFTLSARNVKAFVSMSQYLGVPISEQMQKLFVSSLDKADDRMDMFNALSDLKSSNPQLIPIFTVCKNRMLKLKNLTVPEEIALFESEGDTSEKKEVPDLIASEIEKNNQSAKDVYDSLKGTERQKINWMVKGISNIRLTKGAQSVPDGYTIWQTVSPLLKDPTAVASLQGAAIDLYMNEGRQSPLDIARATAAIGLPKGREIDEIRSLWTYAEHYDGADFNPFEFYSSALRNILYRKLMKGAQSNAEKAAVNDAFLQFYSEALMNPVPMLSFSALEEISALMNDPTALLLRNSDLAIKLSTGQTLRLNVDSINSVLDKSMSVHYLDLLNNIISSTKDKALKRRAAFTLWRVVIAYDSYANSDFSRDVSARNVARLMDERWKWNPNENPYMLVEALANKFGPRPGLQTALNKLNSIDAGFANGTDRQVSIFSTVSVATPTR